MVYFDLMKPILKTLPNGLRVVMIPMEDSPAVTAMVLVAVGSEHEKDGEKGLAHFLEHMCFKGTTKRPSSLMITRELEGLGARTNAFTGRQLTGYYAKAQSRHLPKILDIISDLYLNPVFPEPEMEKEKGVVIEEINMYEDMPQYKVDDVFDVLMFGDTPQGAPIIGSKQSVRAFTQADLQRFREQHYHATSSVVVVSGAFDPKDTLAQIKVLFGDVAPGAHPNNRPIKKNESKKRVAIGYKKSEQTHMILGMRALPLGHKDEITQSLLSTILGGSMSSRLFHKLREELGACYYVSSSANSYSQYGMLTINAGIQAKRLEEVTSVIVSELARMRDELVSDEELKIAKNITASGLVLGLETSNALAHFYGSQEIMQLVRRTPKDLTKALRAVTSKDIQKLARTLFTPEAFRLAVVGPVKGEERLDSLLG